MLGYAWANQGATSLSSAPSAEETSSVQPDSIPHATFPIYDHSPLQLPKIFSTFPPPPPSVAVAAVAGEDGQSLHHYPLSLPPGPVEAPARIGFDPGVRTYFSSSSDGELVRLDVDAYRLTNAAAGDHSGAVFGGLNGGCPFTAWCLAEGCGADLTTAKNYYRRHKVCEFHSKAGFVVVHGLAQRFCQQCSRFHVLSEFDQGKRSCRRRLAEHNRRRRKTTRPPPSRLPSSPPPPANLNLITARQPSVAAEETTTKGGPPGAGGWSMVATATVAVVPAPTMRMGEVPIGADSAWWSSPSCCSSCSKLSSNSVPAGPYRCEEEKKID